MSNAETYDKSVIIGGHFYDPPRKVNHWQLSEISTDPLKIDWTLKSLDVCYRPIARQNLFEDGMSFDFYTPVRQRINMVDGNTSEQINRGLEKWGIGDPIIHAIFPDLDNKDKDILIKAGVDSFKKDSGTDIEPNCFWAPESALDLQTLNYLKENNYKAVLCAPEQIIRDDGKSSANNPTRIRLMDNKEIIAVPFDGYVSRELAFNPKFNADSFTETIIRPAMNYVPRNMPLVTWTDGETYGLHNNGAVYFLSYLIKNSLKNYGLKTISVSEFINNLDEKSLGTGKLIERTAWSCHCGDLKRWSEPCGCLGGDLNWKRPFKKTFTDLNNQISDLVIKHTGPDKYVETVSKNFLDAFYYKGDKSKGSEFSLIAAKVSSLTSLTSCGTFFDNLNTSGRINILFGYQAIQHLKDSGITDYSNIENAFISNLRSIEDKSYNGHGRTGYDILKEILD